MDENPQESLKSLVFAENLVQQPDVVQRFCVLDEICSHTIQLILQHTNFVEEHFTDILAKVAGNLTHGRTVFVKDSGDGSDVSLFKTDAEVSFLEKGINLFNCLSAYRQDKDKIKDVIRETRFARLVYEEVITDFINRTAGYCSLANRYTYLHCYLDRATNVQAHKIAVSLADTHDEMAKIEESIGVERNDLYHLSLAVQEFWQRYLSVREQIIQPYMRVAYKEARNRATTEEQVVENFQNGAQGLIRAVSCYNQHRMINFSSYCRWWVRQNILLRLKEDSNLVKLPATTWQAHTSIQRVKNHILNDDDNEVEDHVINETGLSREKVRSTQDAVKASQMFSLDHPIDDNESTLSSILGVDHQFTMRNEEVEVRNRLASLSEKQRIILALRFGVFDLIVDKGDVTEENKFFEMVRQKVTANRMRNLRSSYR